MDYYDDFWTTAGFAGHDEPEHMATLLIDQKFTIGTVLKLSDLPPENFMARIALSSGAPDRNYCIRLVEDLDDPTQLFGARIRVLSGAAAGRELHISGCDDGVIQVVGEKTPELFDNVEAGDEIEIDNRRFIAWCHLHQHTIDLDTTTITDPATGDRVFAPEFGGIRAGVVDTIPLAPQVDAYSRRMESYDTGRFEGKMIYVNCTNDSLMWPIGVAAYHRRVRDHLGDAADDSFRLWWVEHGTHGPAEILGPMMTEHKDAGAWRARFAGLDGATDQAMRDLVAWVEVGVAPPENTGYRFNADSGLVLTDGAARGGIQPVVQLTANGGTRTEVAVGETVSFRGTADAPKDAGPVVWAQWDFEGTGEVSERAEIDAASDRAVVDATHAFDRPGTYFVGFRAGVHRHGLDGRGPAVENVAVVRVVVKA
jgi:hypothetical protein